MLRRSPGEKVANHDKVGYITLNKHSKPSSSLMSISMLVDSTMIDESWLSLMKAMFQRDMQ
jgi:hypothetical protein